MGKYTEDDRYRDWANSIPDGPDCYPNSVVEYTVFACKALQSAFARFREREQILQNEIAALPERSTERAIALIRLEEVQAGVIWLAANLEVNEKQQFFLPLGGVHGAPKKNRA